MPPTPEERLVIHDLWLEQVSDLRLRLFFSQAKFYNGNGTLDRKLVPENIAFMSDHILSSVRICHPQVFFIPSSIILFAERILCCIRRSTCRTSNPLFRREISITLYLEDSWWRRLTNWHTPSLKLSFTLAPSSTLWMKFRFANQCRSAP